MFWTCACLEITGFEIYSPSKYEAQEWPVEPLRIAENLSYAVSFFFFHTFNVRKILLSVKCEHKLDHELLNS